MPVVHLAFLCVGIGDQQKVSVWVIAVEIGKLYFELTPLNGLDGLFIARISQRPQFQGDTDLDSGVGGEVGVGKF